MRLRSLATTCLGAALLAVLAACGERPEERVVRVAVASNFVEAFEAIAARFTGATGVAVATSAASTGKLCAQIQNGAPFDILLAADQDRPTRLESAGLVVPGSRFTFATGRLALCGPDVDRDDGAASLRAGTFEHLAIANPRNAPYGAAAMQVLEALELQAALETRLVFGENIGQTMQFVDSGGAELGLVSLSQVARREGARFWLVPAELHAPIRQDAVLLAGAGDRDDARALLAFLKSPAAHGILRDYGYDPGSD